MWLALKDKVLVSSDNLSPIPALKLDVLQILLSICALYRSHLASFRIWLDSPQRAAPGRFGGGHYYHHCCLYHHWRRGVGSLNDWQKGKQFEALNEKREERSVKVVRDGREHLIDVHTVVVGDIVLLEPGDIISCDGVFLSGHNVRCDESSATGESDAIKTLSYIECITLSDRHLEEFDPDSPVGDGESTSGSRRDHPSRLDLLGHTDCFIVSGSKFVEGVGSYMVISVERKVSTVVS